MSKSKRPRGGYRKDGKERVRLSLKVTPESIEAAHAFDNNLSTAFERKFTPDA